MTLFDAYLMVDWSGRATPSPARPSPDAIWIGERAPGRRAETYRRTRHDATAHLRRRLLAHAAAGRRVLVGWDFPLGYPRGLARALGLDGRLPPWRAVWDALAGAVADDATNANNRFAVAAAMNARIAGPGPFWGCPPAVAGTHLTATMTGRFAFPVAGLARPRPTEVATPGVQEAWKLYGAGSAGSQALLGIPRVRALRDDPALADVSRVWPFETGFGASPGPPGGRGAFVLHTEFWPGAVALPRGGGDIRDRTQVRLACKMFADRDAAGTLGDWFAPALDAATAAAAVAEEGWILGCAPG